MLALKIAIFIFFYKTSAVNCARILGIIPMPSYSHQIVYQPIWRELSLRGHEVTVLTPNPMRDPNLKNLTEIDLSFSYKLVEEHLQEVLKKKDDPYQSLNRMSKSILTCVEIQLSHPAVQKIINNKNEAFDVVIAESFVPAMSAFAARFKCPLIGALSTDAPEVIYELIGNPSHPVLNPEYTLEYIGNLSFFQRLISTFNKVVAKYLYKVKYLQPADELVRKHFGEGYPTVEEMMRNYSLMFLNTDYILHPVRPLNPSIIHIGAGISKKPPKPLPKDLQEYLDNSHQGFIYFSLGSNIKTKNIANETLQVILETFAELPYNILWKTEFDNLPNKSSNVIISKWFPQQDILRHPNIKLFITQGGLQSIDEAIYDHVPMVGMPFFMDQPINVKYLVKMGLGLSVNEKTLNKSTFKKAILEVIKNPKYKNKIKELAALSKDQPMTGLEKAVWWTEYVIRNKGAEHLRSPLLDIPNYQYLLLDVIGFCLLCVLTLIFITIKFIKLGYKLLSFLCQNSKQKKL